MIEGNHINGTPIMAKKEKKEKRRRSSSASSDGEGVSRRHKALSKFQTVEIEDEPTPITTTFQSAPPPAFTPVVIPDVVVAPPPTEPADERVPLHLLQPGLLASTATAAAAPTALGAASNQASEAASGLLKEPEPPLAIVRVTKDGPPPAMPLDLIDILSG